MSCRESSKNWFAQICYLHYLYVIFILLAALIGVISYYHCSEKDKSLHEFISFAATLSSIILSVLAIFITVMSGESTNKLRDGIMGLLKIPEDLSNKVDKSVLDLNNATKNLNDAAKVNEGTITSSPGPKPHTIHATWREAVQFAMLTAYFTPHISINICSSSAFFGPVLIQPDLMVSYAA